MFDADEVRFAALRPVCPPRPVLVDLRRIWPPTRMTWGRDTPLWMRAGGVDLDEVPGQLTAWVCTCAGDWLGLIEQLGLGSRNRQLRLDHLGPQLIAASALRPAP